MFGLVSKDWMQSIFGFVLLQPESSKQGSVQIPSRVQFAKVGNGVGATGTVQFSRVYSQTRLATFWPSPVVSVAQEITSVSTQLGAGGTGIGVGCGEVKGVGDGVGGFIGFKFTDILD